MAELSGGWESVKNLKGDCHNKENKYKIYYLSEIFFRKELLERRMIYSLSYCFPRNTKPSQGM